MIFNKAVVLKNINHTTGAVVIPRSAVYFFTNDTHYRLYIADDKAFQPYHGKYDTSMLKRYIWKYLISVSRTKIEI
jgi:hypothetical protein